MRQPIWQRAASFAARMHKDDCRDDKKTPYISHPVRVAMAVRHLFQCDDDDAIAAALLHDVMENTDEGYDQLRREFGGDVADMVVALTKNMMLPYKKREKEYEKRLAKADWRARLVKLADELDNFTDTLTGLKEGNGEEKSKARKMIVLARADVKKHPPTRRAISALQKLLKVKRIRK